jgi:hypothetical protein
MAPVFDPHEITPKYYHKINALQYVSIRFGCHYVRSRIMLVSENEYNISSRLRMAVLFRITSGLEICVGDSWCFPVTVQTF